MGFLEDMDTPYKVTDLRTHTSYYYRHANDMYNRIMMICKNHDQAVSMISWAEEAPYGDNWTWDDVDITILGDEESWLM